MARRSWGKIRQLPSGRYQASYVGPDLLRHTAARTYPARMDAEGWLVDERRLIERATWTPPAQRAAEKRAEVVTLGAYAQRWIDHRPLKARSRIGYQSLLDTHIKDDLGAVPLRSLTPDAVRHWYAGLDKSTPTARAHAYQLLHAVCATAVADGLMAANPCAIPRAMLTKTKRQPVILTVAEVDELASTIKPGTLRALILVLAWCGPRWGEAVELRRRDVNADASVLTVARGATHRDKVCRIDTPKSGRGRSVVVPPHIRADLVSHLEQHVAKGADALLFPPRLGGCHLNDKVFRESYRTALVAIGRKDPLPTVHDLRHFAGTMAARVGNLVETMDRLGHVTPRASLIYQQIVSGRDAEVAEALSRLARGDVDHNTP